MVISSGINTSRPLTKEKQNKILQSIILLQQTLYSKLSRSVTHFLLYLPYFQKNIDRLAIV